MAAQPATPAARESRGRRNTVRSTKPNKTNGKRYQTEFVHIFTVRNGKVVAFRELLDSAAVAAAFE